MTLRIFVEARAEGGVVRLHGWLSGAVVAEVEKAVVDSGSPSRIDLTHLAGVDAGGLALLKRLRAGGTLLEGASPYVTLLLGSQVAAGTGEPESGEGDR